MRIHAALALATSLTAAALLAGCSGAASDADVVGAWGDRDTQTSPSLEFADDGTFGGTDGCNLLFGEYEVAGSTVEFSEMRSTLMFCEDVDTWLSTAASAELSGDQLRLYDAAGAEIGTLDRS